MDEWKMTTTLILRESLGRKRGADENIEKEREQPNTKSQATKLQQQNNKLKIRQQIYI